MVNLKSVKVAIMSENLLLEKKLSSPYLVTSLYAVFLMPSDTCVTASNGPYNGVPLKIKSCE